MGAKLKRRRRDLRLGKPPGMRLTARDVDVIEAVYRFRVLKQEHIQRLFFGSKDTAQYRLAHLFDHHYLDRRFLPVMLGEGRSPTLYVLDRRGAEVLRMERGYDEIKWFSTSKDLTSQFLEHTTAINDFMVAVAVACRNSGFELEQWRTESDLKADYDRVSIVTATGSHEEVSVIPDGFFTIIAHSRRWPFFLELDRGTMELKRFKDKIRAYLAYHVSGSYQRRFGTSSIRVLTVVSPKHSETGGMKRLENLKASTEEITKERWFWFATLNSLSPEMVLSAPVWYQVTERERKRLIVVPLPSNPEGS